MSAEQYKLQEKLGGGVKEIRADFKFPVEKEEKLGTNHGLTLTVSVQFFPNFTAPPTFCGAP